MANGNDSDRRPGLTFDPSDTATATGIVVLGALAFLIAVRAGFRGFRVRIPS